MKRLLSLFLIASALAHKDSTVNKPSMVIREDKENLDNMLSFQTNASTYLNVISEPEFCISPSSTLPLQATSTKSKKARSKSTSFTKYSPPPDDIQLSRELHRLVMQNDVHNVEKMLVSGRANHLLSRSYSFGSFLFLAVGQGYESMVTLLLDYGSDPNYAYPGNGYTVLFYAINFQNVNFARQLLEKGAFVDGYVKGKTPFAHACTWGHLSTMQLLLEYKADINAVDDKGFTSLNIAVRKGYKEIVIFLLEKNANVNIVNLYGVSPLMTAAGFGYRDICNLLLQHEADVSLVAIDNGDAMALALWNGNFRIALDLRRYGAAFPGGIAIAIASSAVGLLVFFSARLARGVKKYLNPVVVFFNKRVRKNFYKKLPFSGILLFFNAHLVEGAKKYLHSITVFFNKKKLTNIQEESQFSVIPALWENKEQKNEVKKNLTPSGATPSAQELKRLKQETEKLDQKIADLRVKSEQLLEEIGYFETTGGGKKISKAKREKKDSKNQQSVSTSLHKQLKDTILHQTDPGIASQAGRYIYKLIILCGDIDSALKKMNVYTNEGKRQLIRYLDSLYHDTVQEQLNAESFLKRFSSFPRKKKKNIYQSEEAADLKSSENFEMDAHEPSQLPFTDIEPQISDQKQSNPQLNDNITPLVKRQEDKLKEYKWAQTSVSFWQQYDPEKLKKLIDAEKLRELIKLAEQAKWFKQLLVNHQTEVCPVVYCYACLATMYFFTDAIQNTTYFLEKQQEKVESKTVRNLKRLRNNLANNLGLIDQQKVLKVSSACFAFLDSIITNKCMDDPERLFEQPADTLLSYLMTYSGGKKMPVNKIPYIKDLGKLFAIDEQELSSEAFALASIAQTFSNSQKQLLNLWKEVHSPDKQTSDYAVEEAKVKRHGGQAVIDRLMINARTVFNQTSSYVSLNN